MTASILILAAFFTTIAMNFMAAVSDFKKMQIENYISIIIVASFFFAYIVDLLLLPNTDILGIWWHSIVAVIIVFLITFAMFSIGMIGGGDSKLASALALWIGLKGLISFIFYMSIAGGVLGVIALICRKKDFLKPLAEKLGEQSWPAAILEGKNALPYGIAILFGAVGSFLYTGLPQNILNNVMNN